MRGRPGTPALLCLILSAACVACSQELFDNESDLVVLNDSACAIKIIVDGREAFTVKPGADRILDGIGKGRHVLEAIEGVDQVVERRTVELSQGEDFYWTLDHCQPQPTATTEQPQ